MKLNNNFKLNRKEQCCKRKHGFTLVEMIIVVTILGILASVAIVKYGKVESNAKQNIDYTNASNIASAAIIAMSEGMPSSQVTVNNLVTKGYLNSDPKPQSVDAESFAIEIKDDGKNIIIKAGESTMYPKPESNSLKE